MRVFIAPRQRERKAMMERKQLMELLEEGPVIASVKDGRGLASALESNVSVVFLLSSDVLTVEETVSRVRAAGKRVFVHVDLVEGLAGREIAADYIARHTQADGIISTRDSLTRRAKELGLLSVRRVFLLDSMALTSIERHLAQDASDIIEVLPGLMPKMIQRLTAATRKPIIAGGLITDKEDVTRALSAGALAVSSTNQAVSSL